jgi:hypothetical protein
MAGSYRVVITNMAGRVVSDAAVITVQPPAMQLDSELLVDGRVRIRLTGPAGLVFELQSSTELGGWTTIQTSGAQTGEIVHVTPEAVTADHRFYRGYIP